MPPKRGRKGDGLESPTKKTKASSTPVSRSATPVEPDLPEKINFKVEYPAAPAANQSSKSYSAKVTANYKDAELHISPFATKDAPAGTLNRYYKVIPAQDWNSMKPYNQFIIHQESFRIGQIVSVRGDAVDQSGQPDQIDSSTWIGQVVQIRAKDSQNVYALIVWFYWPDELPPIPGKPGHGRASYHGRTELVPSNHLDVVDVMSIGSKLEVTPWLEENDVDPSSASSPYYWRQTFCAATAKLSKIRKHCVCKGHQNPDIAMFMCDNSDCGIWLHNECILDDKLTKTYNKSRSFTISTSKGKRSNAIKPYDGALKGKILDPKDGEPVMIEITDLESEDQSISQEKARCPKCDTVITG